MADVTSPIDEEPNETDRLVAFVVKLHKFTKKGRIVWRRSPTPTAGAAADASVSFDADYKKYTYRLSMRPKAAAERGVGSIGLFVAAPAFSEEYRLELLTQGLVADAFPSVEALRGLFAAVQRQTSSADEAANVDDAMKSLLDEE